MSSSPDILAGAVAIVTGVLGKLGPIWTEALLGAGAAVVGLDLPGVATSPAFSGLEERFGSRLHLVRADVTDRASLLAARDRIHALLGAPHVLVNNAGIDQPPSAAARTYRIEDMPI